jgi:hypothetical protein
MRGEDCTSHGVRQASFIHWIPTRPPHHPKPNTPRARGTAARGRGRPPHNPERRRPAPCSTSPHLIRARSRPTHSRAPREYLCKSHFCLFPVAHIAFFFVSPAARHTHSEGRYCLIVTKQKVNCQHGHVYPRTVFQAWLGEANPHWRTFLAELERTGAQPKTNPDGDVVSIL